MWVVLVVGILQQEYDDGRKHTLRKRLRDIPGDLHELFRDILTRDHRNRDELLLCIQWVLFARNPLTPEQLYFAILSGTDTAAVSEWNSEELEELDISKFILSSSKGLAEVTRSKDPTVQFIHESVRDFLLKEEGLKEVWSSPGRDVQGQSHERLKQCCLSYMSIGFSILKFEGTQERVRQQSEKEFPFLKFAVQNILFHADAAQGRGICQKDFLKTLQLTNWTKLNNLFEKHKVRRYGPNASLLYILAEQNFENLIKRRPDEQSCFQVETERYGAPILAAIATASRDTVYALLSAEAEAEPLMSPLHELCERYHESDGSPSNFGREFRFSPKRGLLIYLIERKENEIVMFILSSSKYNAGIGNTDVTGRTALSFAVEYCTADVVGLLIERGAEIDLADKKGRSPLSYAVCHKHIDVVRLLLDRGAQIDLADQYGRSPLSYAARHTHVDVVRLLLGRGAQIDLADNAGRTPLLHAVAFDSEKTMQVLLNKGARIEEADKEGRTPLSHAAEGSEVCMRLLLTQGASVEMTDKNGRTPLSHAAAAGIGTCTRLLLDRGAQTEIADVRGRTPLSHAAQARNPTALKVLLDHKAHIDMTDSQGRTPLSHAAGSVSSDGLRLLIGAGAQIEMADNNGRTPLSYAAEMGQTKMLQLLIDNGSNVDVPDNKGRTPLSYAAACSQKIPGRRYSNAVRLLLARGAETETADNTGQTPLSYARASRNSDAYIIQLFKEHARMSTTMDPP